MRNLLIITILFLGLTISFGQSKKQVKILSASKHASLGKNLSKKGIVDEAADHYFEAFKLKPTKLKYASKAGELFMQCKDYQRAVDCFYALKDKIKDYPLARFQYANALMNNGQYDDASREYVYFIETYKGKDADAMALKAQSMKRNCDFGLKLMNTYQKDIVIEHLPTNINSTKFEFSPIPYSDNMLYFSSTMKGGMAKLFRTTYSDDKWSDAEPATGFSMNKEAHFGNGTFSPDMERFYYTQCEGVEEKGKVISRCKIYVLKNKNNKWSSPQVLHPYINAENSTTTQPHIAHTKDKEILYFVSDREGGKGGLDIWYAVRDLHSNDIDFSAPLNAGNINTELNDITPFYDSEEETMYYSSTGMQSAGGLDIYKATGKLGKWSKPTNLGIPINSSADDYYYVLNKDKTSGYLVSNRTFGAEKFSTRDEDIFRFNVTEKELYAAGSILDIDTKKPINGSRVSLYEVTDDNNKKLLESKILDDSKYRFTLLKVKNYKIEFDKDGFYSTFFESTTNEKNKQDYGRIVNLQAFKKEALAENTSKPVITVSDIDKKDKVIVDNSYKAVKVSSKKTRAKEVYENALQGKYGDLLVSKGEIRNTKSKNNSETLITTAPIKTGTYYKIQVLAYQRMNQTNTKKLANLVELGRIDTEFFEEKNVSRALISDFASYDEAKAIIPKVKGQGFLDAFIVKYTDGIRIGAGK
jgi:tetratricopeptide (TPR) repeat protein